MPRRHEFVMPVSRGAKETKATPNISFLYFVPFIDKVVIILVSGIHYLRGLEHTVAMSALAILKFSLRSGL